MQGLEMFGNPSSLHSLGFRAEKLISSARESIARSVGASPEEVFFTSCATESNNTAIFGAANSVGRHKKKIVTTTVEHPSVAVCCDRLEERGFDVVRIAPDANGIISAESIVSAVDDNTCLVTTMLVNNETGRVLPIEKAFSAIKKKFPRVLTHCDCVQGYLKLKIKFPKLFADMISVSAHKIHGPKGIGALIVKKGVHIPPYICGGGQEKGLRSGTESVPLICGFGAAVDRYSADISERYQKVSQLRTHLAHHCENTPGVYLYSDGDCSPYVSIIAVEGLKSEVLLHFLEEREVYVSSGSACSKGKKSAVIREFKIPQEHRDCVLRISFDSSNTLADVDSLFEFIKDAQKSLCKIK